MRRRWYYFKRAARENLILVPVLFIFVLLLLFFWRGRRFLTQGLENAFHTYGVQTGSRLMKQSFPALAEEGEESFFERLADGQTLIAFLRKMSKEIRPFDDPAYDKAMARAKKAESFGADGDEETESSGTPDDQKASKDTGQESERSGEVIAIKPAGSGIVMEKLADYDYMMKSFYSVHPTTTADRDLMNAKRFMSMDFHLEKNGDVPQILIYHTHSQEEFSDYPGNPEATIVTVGSYLTELLQQKGYNVLHDVSVYDLRDGKLDRSQAYTYALDGISGILQKNPSVEVVLDIHRDGVNSGTRLVSEVNGKRTAQIMFFNGLSQTPDGAIEYLPNPNREANLGFSFQLQLAASRRFPGFTRKIYLKGLRYNEHVRARSALIEVGAQTNTCEEAKNAMEPLSELLDGVLSGGED